MIRANPMALFAGSPLYVFYLRLLGAKIGRGVVILSKTVPVCTDLLTIGSGTVIRKESFFQGYRAHAGRIQTGSGHHRQRRVSSARRPSSTSIPGWATGRSWGTRRPCTAVAGCRPANTGTVLRRSAPRSTICGCHRLRCGTFRRLSAAILTLLEVFFIVMPLVQGGVEMVLSAVPSIAELVQPGQDAVGTPEFFVDAAVISLVLFVGGVVLGWLFVMTVPRFLNLFLTPEKVYPLYGMHYRISHAITRMTNVKFFTQLFGNSSYSVYYLRRLGYHLFRIKQTGSNFGDEVAHDNPYLCSVGRGTVVADGLSMINTEYLEHVHAVVSGVDRTPQLPREQHCLSTAGPDRRQLPAGNKGHDSPRRTDPRRGGAAGLAGLRDPAIGRAGQPVQPAADRRGPATQCWPRRTATTCGPWVCSCSCDGCTSSWSPCSGWPPPTCTRCWTTPWSVRFSPSASCSARCTTFWSNAASRHSVRLKPRLCSYYEPYFWWHERLWKVPADTYLNVFNGTPFKNVIWRSLGVRLGRGVFDDGCYLTERTLVSIGDHAVLNAGSKVQCHSQEDGAFKSDHTIIGADCTLGVGAFVHYGVTMGDGAVLDPDSFLMKGETVPPADPLGRESGDSRCGPACHRLQRPAARVAGGSPRRPPPPRRRGPHRYRLPAPTPARTGTGPGTATGAGSGHRGGTGSGSDLGSGPGVGSRSGAGPGPVIGPAPGPRWAPPPGPARGWSPAPGPRPVPAQDRVRVRAETGTGMAPAPGPRWVPIRHRDRGPAPAPGPGRADGRRHPAPVGHPHGHRPRRGPVPRHPAPVRHRPPAPVNSSQNRCMLAPNRIGRHHLSVVRRSEIPTATPKWSTPSNHDRRSTKGILDGNAIECRPGVLARRADDRRVHCHPAVDRCSPGGSRRTRGADPERPGGCDTSTGGRPVDLDELGSARRARQGPFRVVR